MAGVIIPRASFRPFLSAPCEFRAVSHQPSFPRTVVFTAGVYGLGCSRAGRVGPLGDRAYRRDVRIGQNGLQSVGKYGREAFSTSVVRRDGKSERKGTKPVAEREHSKVSLQFLFLLI